MDLCNSQHTPRVPKLIRDTARSMLRHYPSDWDMQQAAESAPEVFAERMEDLHRFVAAGARESGFRAERSGQQTRVIPIDDNHEGSTTD